jgi:hypothetical protein
MWIFIGMKIVGFDKDGNVYYYVIFFSFVLYGFFALWISSSYGLAEPQKQERLVFMKYVIIMFVIQNCLRILDL